MLCRRHMVIRGGTLNSDTIDFLSGERFDDLIHLPQKWGSRCLVPVYSLSPFPNFLREVPKTSMENMCRRHIPLGQQQKLLGNRRMCLCANEWYATGTPEGWHVALDGLLICDQTMLIDQQLASIPQHSGYMFFGESICLKFQCFVCSREETLAFVPVNQMPREPFRLATLGIPRLHRHPSFDSGFTQTNGWCCCSGVWSFVLGHCILTQLPL